MAAVLARLQPLKRLLPGLWAGWMLCVALLATPAPFATLAVGDRVLMGADPPFPDYTAPQGISVSIGIASPAEGERVFNALAEGGTVGMPFQKTFWSPGFGMVVDRFGIPWMVNCGDAAPDPAGA